MIFVPQHSGGRLDPVGGRRLQIQDLEKIKAVEAVMKRPAMLTLTIDRDGKTTGRGFASPEEAYEAARKLVSRLLSERLGARTWIRVMEVQEKTGDGWVHWHALIDLVEVGGLHKARKRAWRYWRDEWGIGGCDLKPIYKSAAGYMAKYISKEWKAIPIWMGESTKRFRLLGASKRAGVIIRAALGIATKPWRPSEGSRRYKKTRTLFERLASSGLQTSVIFRDGDGRTHFIETIQASLRDIIGVCSLKPMPWVGVEAEEAAVYGRIVERQRLRCEARGGLKWVEMRVRALAAAVEKWGLPAMADRDYATRLERWRVSWATRKERRNV
ncbi:MAG: hypothetical protein ACF8NJ_00815 [Phycisphaerales bacterium JB038]